MMTIVIFPEVRTFLNVMTTLSTRRIKISLITDVTLSRVNEGDKSLDGNEQVRKNFKI